VVQPSLSVADHTPMPRSSTTYSPFGVCFYFLMLVGCSVGNIGGCYMGLGLGQLYIREGRHHIHIDQL